ncbi:putative RNA methyltransferase [Arthrobacter sp. RIT-PI-e]|uniref:putative RNA methyltransferase n=1 Tax=Arthrobacter sp. RIT-PI-e TaxID=1681197 RepID=UPI000676951E|nr:methyltransferase domain-containing protein [Arthrobacter sp. RIT-PI-e]
MPAIPASLLRCPVCTGALSQQDRALVCDRGHRFDAARQGYVNLLTGRGSSFEGDDARMVDAREEFLASGHYAPLRDAVVSAVQRHRPDASVVLDAGAGTGYYLRGVVDAAPDTFPVAIDVSKPALRRAARRIPEGIGLVWDIWRPLPLTTGSVDVLLNVFAPRNTDEFLRVLSPDGCVVVVTPRPGHLAELASIGPLLSVPAQKADDVAASFSATLIEAERRELDHVMHLPEHLARSALVMGPAARHSAVAGGRHPGGTDDDPPELEVSARFTIQVLTTAGDTKADNPGDGTEV